jgi:hypothetical protein
VGKKWVKTDKFVGAKLFVEYQLTNKGDLVPTAVGSAVLPEDTTKDNRMIIDKNST